MVPVSARSTVSEVAESCVLASHSFVGCSQWLCACISSNRRCNTALARVNYEGRSSSPAPWGLGALPRPLSRRTLSVTFGAVDGSSSRSGTHRSPRISHVSASPVDAQPAPATLSPDRDPQLPLSQRSQRSTQQPQQQQQQQQQQPQAMPAPLRRTQSQAVNRAGGDTQAVPSASAIFELRRQTQLRQQQQQQQHVQQQQQQHEDELAALPAPLRRALSAGPLNPLFAASGGRQPIAQYGAHVSLRRTHTHRRTDASVTTRCRTAGLVLNGAADTVPRRRRSTAAATAAAPLCRASADTARCRRCRSRSHCEPARRRCACVPCRVVIDVSGLSVSPTARVPAATATATGV